MEVQIDALPGRAFTGKVEAVDAQLDADGRSLLVRARLADPQGELRSGMFVRARTVFAVRQQATLVPEEALVPQRGKQYLIEVVDGPTGQVSQRLEARIGARLPGKVDILGGLRGDALPLRAVAIEAPAAPRRPARAASSAARDFPTPRSAARSARP